MCSKWFPPCLPPCLLPSLLSLLLVLRLGPRTLCMLESHSISKVHPSAMPSKDTFMSDSWLPLSLLPDYHKMRFPLLAFIPCLFALPQAQGDETKWPWLSNIVFLPKFMERWLTQEYLPLGTQEWDCLHVPTSGPVHFCVISLFFCMISAPRIGVKRDMSSLSPSSREIQYSDQI